METTSHEKFDFFWEKLEKMRTFQSFNVFKIFIKLFEYVIKKYHKRREVIIFKVINSRSNSEFNQGLKNPEHGFNLVELKFRFFLFNQFFHLKSDFLTQLLVFRKTIFDIFQPEKSFSNLKKIQPRNNFSIEINLSNPHKYSYLYKKKNSKNFKEFFYNKKKNNKNIFLFKNGFKKFFREIMFFFFWINFWEGKENFLCSNYQIIQKINLHFLFKSNKNSSKFLIFKYFFVDIKTFFFEKLQSFDILFQLIVRNIFYEKKTYLSKCFILITDLFNFANFVYKLKKTILILELLKGSLFHKKFIGKNNQEKINLITNNSVFILKIPNKIQKIFTLLKIENLRLKLVSDWIFFFLKICYVDVGRKIIMNFLYKFGKINQIELIKKIFFYEIQKKNIYLANKVLIFLILNFKNQTSVFLKHASMLHRMCANKSLFDFINEVLKKKKLDTFDELKKYFFKFILNIKSRKDELIII